MLAYLEKCPDPEQLSVSGLSNTLMPKKSYHTNHYIVKRYLLHTITILFCNVLYKFILHIINTEKPKNVSVDMHYR